jgi:hypothetical protein
MAKIIPNDLLNPTEKTIKNWNCSFIAVEGPNILDKLNLEDLAIPYESQYRSRIILKAGETDQPLIYGFIGKAVTFLMIKVTYDSENDPYYQYEQEKYNITYYFENDPILRPLNRLMAMTGSVDNKIPQIYLNNPLDYDVVLDVMHATVDSVYDSGTTFTGFGMLNLSDVSFSGLTSGDTLTYDGTKWINTSTIAKKYLITNITDTYSGVTEDQYIRCSGTSYTVYLPVATGSGKELILKSLASGVITISGYGTDLIDSLVSIYLTSPYDYIRLIDAEIGGWETI